MKVLCYPNPVLLQEAADIEAFGEDLEKTAARMLETMYVSRGIGLAGPQVGIPGRLIVVNTAAAPGEGEEIALVNPEIVEESGELAQAEEGCLSLPGINGVVVRPQKIVVRGFDPRGAERYIEAQGMLSRVLQHEIDHLDGILFISKLSPVDRSAIKAKLKELRDKTDG